jgi:hypothetical protein
MKVIINPFTKQVVVLDKKEEVELYYDDIDEWVSFTLSNRVYDIHILYDSGLDVSIYNVIDGVIDYEKSIKSTVKVIY